MGATLSPLASAASTAAISDPAAARHSKLVKAAQQFEAVMLGEMLKPLCQANNAIGGDEDAGSPGPMQSYGVEAVAGALAKTGALGFAQRLVHSVESRESGLHENSTKIAQASSASADNENRGNE